jgi:hypothetical protein
MREVVAGSLLFLLGVVMLAVCGVMGYVAYIKPEHGFWLVVGILILGSLAVTTVSMGINTLAGKDVTKGLHL